MGQRPIYQYQINRSNPDRAVGILLPFNKPVEGKAIADNYASGSIGAGGVFIQSYTTELQSISNLKNLLLTRKGERYMQPNFGTDIYASVFEPNTDLTRENLQLSLQDDIEFWLPYIQLSAIEVIGNVDSYSISVRIRYTVQNSNTERVIIVLANENEIILSEIDNNPAKLAQVGYF
jgi:phage baseplate assembly protein W